MKKTISIVRLNNGRYVKEYQYSQGIFDMTTTTDVFKACHVMIGPFNTFFKNRGELIVMTLTCKENK